jgi:hypothetical protein
VKGFLVGTGLTLIVLLVLESFIGNGLFSTKTITVTATTTVTDSTAQIGYEQVANAYADRFLLFDTRNVSALLNEYESNATVELTGIGGSRNFTGSSSIAQFLATFPGKMKNLTVTVETQTPAVVSKGDYYVINSTFEFAGCSTLDGNISGKIAAQDSSPR